MKIRVKSLVTDSWLLEICSLVGSLLSMTIIVALLYVYHNEPPFKWHGVTLNALVAIFSTIARSLLAFAVSASLGQWKWLWFSSNRNPLIDFETIDNASRGPLGSLQLLWRTKGRAFVTIGAVITILSLAMEPLVQQVIGLKSTYLLERGTSTSITWAERYSKGVERSFTAEIVGFNNMSFSATEVNTDFGMQSAILYGLSQPQSLVSQQLPFTCPTSFCQWDEFPSLAVCSHCSDLTESMERTQEMDEVPQAVWLRADLGTALGNITQFTLPNGLHINNLDGSNFTGSGGYMTLVAYGTGNSSETVAFQTNNLLIWSMTILKVANISGLCPGLPVSATECALYYCVNNYKSEVSNGTLRETITPTPLERSAGSWQTLSGSWPAAVQDSLQFNTALSSIPRTDLQLGDRFNVSKEAVDSISDYMWKLLSELTRILLLMLDASTAKMALRSFDS